MILLLAACGLAPQPDFATTQTGNGTAPWHDLPAATVCLGDHVIDNAAAPIGGLCLSPLTPGTSACATDTDCSSREACVCGSCTVAYCSSASDCDPTRTCDFAQHGCVRSCRVSTECAAGEDCLSGACRGRCATSEDCQHGEVCDRSHTCITDDCATGADCFPGETCEIQREPRVVEEPSPLVIGAEIWMYVGIDGDIYRAVSADGTHFTIDPPMALITGARAPSAVRADGTGVTLAYETAAGILVATSSDGIAFGAGELVAAGGHAPGLLDPDTLYFARDGAIELRGAGVVLTPTDVQVGDPSDTSSAFWSPVTELASPHAIVGGPPGAETVHLYFSAFGTESAPATKFGMPAPIAPNYSIGFAASPVDDPAAFAAWPYGPVADRVDVFVEHHDELAPAAIQLPDGRWRLYFIDAPRGVPGRIAILGNE